MNIEVIKILQEIARGTHDSMPTRKLPPIDNKIAWEIDGWWQDYYNSNDRSLRYLAKEALNIIYNDESMK